jgi:predicted metalloprotease
LLCSAPIPYPDRHFTILIPSFRIVTIMQLGSRRTSDNVVDRRGSGGKKLAMGGGLGGIIMALIAIFVLKQDPAQVVGNLVSNKSQAQAGEYKPTPQEEALAEFTSKVLATTEDVWNEIYEYAARSSQFSKFRPQPRYVEPKLVMFSGQVASACGNASAAMGPFYCPGDYQVYIDLAFYQELEQKFKASGDFAQAYVVAHEVGHHVQNLLGISRQVQSQRGRISEEAYNQLSVRQELQADYFSGVWAHRAEKQFNILESGDIQEGLNAAGQIGDDRIQKRSQGYVVPESFTHGSAEQRIRWFTLGLKSGDPTAHNPFDLPFEQL